MKSIKFISILIYIINAINLLEMDYYLNSYFVYKSNLVNCGKTMNKIKSRSRNMVETNQNNEKNYKQTDVGLINPTIKDGPLSENEVNKALEDYFYAPDRNAIGIVTFSERLKNQELGKLRINPKNMKMYFPTDKEYMNITTKFFNDTQNKEQISFQINRDYNEILSMAEKPENLDFNPYERILDKEVAYKDLSKNSTEQPELNEIFDEYNFSKNNKRKKDLLQQQILYEEKLYKRSLDSLSLKNEKYNKNIYSPLMKYNMKNLQRYRSEKFKIS